MNKKNYQTPELLEMQLAVENGIAVSTQQWYEKGGEGDFDYIVTEDETWG